tara:strand:+ start:15080 stop:15247 length:168 start_codon:yes stop_codon:yes gene_type:complete
MLNSVVSNDLPVLGEEIRQIKIFRGDGKFKINVCFHSSKANSGFSFFDALYGSTP